MPKWIIPGSRSKAVAENNNTNIVIKIIMADIKVKYKLCHYFSLLTENIEYENVIHWIPNNCQSEGCNNSDRKVL